MSETNVNLGRLALGYAPLLNKGNDVLGTRVTLMPLRADAELDAAPLLQVLEEFLGSQPVVLNVQHEALLRDLVQMPLPEAWRLELPAFLAADASLAAPLETLRRRQALLLRGTATAPSAQQTVVLDADQLAHHLAQGQVLSNPVLLCSVRGQTALAQAFERGASGVMGWPMGGHYEALADQTRQDVGADLRVIMDLMSKVDQGEDVEQLETTLKRDPNLAFRLLRYMNSAAFGLPVEVSSFRHALMLLGYGRLKRWLALLLATASKDARLRPIMFAALRRGLLLEELGQSLSDATQRDELFICGLFSLLDHLLQQPFAQLLDSIPVPQRVHQALVEHSGPYLPYVQLAQAIEAESLFDIRDTATALMITQSEITRAVLCALAKAHVLS
ncbi:HDOD domain-containing protein [Roseateles sp. BYS180W]|uniref:HDOD domain-containing protein n=1 Tax=Roseateles rivi TaxID=3299028 RepID=A0ABW7FV08_9BURK